MRNDADNPADAGESHVDVVLADFIRCRCDPVALAEHLGVSPFHLLDFFHRADVAERLEKLEELIARGERLQEAQARASALAALQRVTEDEGADPTERRRAAATILRAVSKRRERRSETDRARSGPVGPPKHDQPEPRGGPGAARARTRPTENQTDAGPARSGAPPHDEAAQPPIQTLIQPAIHPSIQAVDLRQDAEPASAGRGHARNDEGAPAARTHEADLIATAGADTSSPAPGAPEMPLSGSYRSSMPSLRPHAARQPAETTRAPPTP